MSKEQIPTNQNGELLLGGISAVALANKYGTPLYVMDEACIRSAMRLYKSSIDRYYAGNGLPLYASKAFSCKEIYRIAAQEGFGVDVVSGGELATALAADFDPSRIYFHGNNKTDDELAYAIDSRVGVIVVDNLTELAHIDRLAAERGVTADIMLRIKPGIDAHTHDYIRTGQIDSKFGLALENGEALEGVRAALACKGVSLVGLHCHVGSQIFETQPFADAASVMLHFMAEIKAQFGVALEKLNLGGGFGIRYVEGDHPLAYDAYMCAVSQRIIEECKALSLDVPFILIEPG
ncbi:MAG: diaminopimelate decarboxylase, partial [Clostridia bacterium]|nr:diaminopimelate decarboxylase [Clostridia bacterium]